MEKLRKFHEHSLLRGAQDEKHWLAERNNKKGKTENDECVQSLRLPSPFFQPLQDLLTQGRARLAWIFHKCLSLHTPTGSLLAV